MGDFQNQDYNDHCQYQINETIICDNVHLREKTKKNTYSFTKKLRASDIWHQLQLLYESNLVQSTKELLLWVMKKWQQVTDSHEEPGPKLTRFNEADDAMKVGKDAKPNTPDDDKELLKKKMAAEKKKGAKKKKKKKKKK